LPSPAPIKPALAVAGSESEQLVVFTLGGEPYGLPITRVQEIIRYTTPRSVPDAAFGIRGVINLRSKIIPVGDTRELLGVHASGDEDHQNVVIVETAAGPCGLIVDAVTEVISVDAGSVDGATRGRGTRGIARVGDRLLIVVEVDELFPHSLEGALREAA
jgi:chemotaxis signal transduction protein